MTRALETVIGRRRRRVARAPSPAPDRGGGACRLALGLRGTRIALMEVAIGKAQAGDRAAEAVIVDPLHPEARLDRQAVEVRAHRGRLHPDACRPAMPQNALAAAADGRIVPTTEPSAKDAARCRPCRRSRCRRTACRQRKRAPVPAQAPRRQPNVTPKARIHTTTATRSNICNPTLGRELDINKTS